MSFYTGLPFTVGSLQRGTRSRNRPQTCEYCNMICAFYYIKSLWYSNHLNINVKCNALCCNTIKHQMFFYMLVKSINQQRLTFPPQLPMVDVAVFLFFLLSSLILLILDHNQLKGCLKRAELLTKPQRFFLQVDFFANFICGLMWLVFPEWLLGSQVKT